MDTTDTIMLAEIDAFVTDDLYLASALIALGFRLGSFTPAEPYGTFSFAGTDRLTRAALDYYRWELEISAAAYAEAIKRTKKLVMHTRQAGR